MQANMQWFSDRSRLPPDLAWPEKEHLPSDLSSSGPVPIFKIENANAKIYDSSNLRNE